MLLVDGWPHQAIYAIDASHERGGIAMVDQSAAAAPVTIKLLPLVRVMGKVYCSEAGRTPQWTNVTVYITDDNGNQKKFMTCGSVSGAVFVLITTGRIRIRRV